jgi:hypothetical protein
MVEQDYSRKMLNEIRKRTRSALSESLDDINVHEKDNIVNQYKTLMDEAVDLANKGQLNEDEQSQGDKDKVITIKRGDVQFGSVRNSQEAAIKKAVGDVKLKDDALKYYSKLQDLVINGEINGLGVTFQFRYKDPSGDGCYIWSQGLQLTDSNLRTIQKIRDAFLNWKQSLVEDGDLLEKLDKEANKL